MKVIPGVAGSSKVKGSRNEKYWFCSWVWYQVPSGSAISTCSPKPEKLTPFLVALILPSTVASTAGLPSVPGRFSPKVVAV